MRKGFTLIEVMVAVVIISVVIAALLQMRGNSSNIFLNLSKQLHVNQMNSFIISNDNYGFESKSTTLNEFLNDFRMEDDLRRKLKEVKVKISYEKLENIEIDSDMVLEIGRTILKTEDSSASLIRLRLK